MTPAEKMAAAKKPKPLKPTGRASHNRKRTWVCTLREERTKLRLTLRDVANGTGLSNVGVYDIERGTDPQLSTARRIAAFFGKSVGELWPRLLSEKEQPA